MAQCATRPFMATTAVFLVLASPGLAQQITAKTAWETLRAAAQENGVIITSGGIVDNRSSLIVSDVRILSEEDRDAGELTMDSLRIEPRGEHVTLIPSELMTLVVRPNALAERAFEIRHQGEITYRVTEDEMDFGLAFASLDVRMVRALRRGVALSEALGAVFTDLQGDLFVAREGTVELSLTAGRLGYDFAFDQQIDGTSMNNVGNAQVEDLSIAFEALEMDMMSDDDGALARAFDAGFMARLVMTTGPSTGDSVQRFDGQEISVRQSAQGSSLLMALADGAFSMTSTAEAGVIQGGMGPLQGEVSLGGAAIDLSFPLVASDADRPIQFGFLIDSLTPTPETLGMLGAQAFAGDSLSLALRLGADGRLIEDLGPDFGQGDQPPIDISNVRLEDLSLSVGDTQLTGSGAFIFLGGLAASIDADLPNGTGDFVFDLMGGDAFVTRLATAGLIPPDQQFFARMMMNGLGRPVGEDHLRSEVAIRPGGAVTVNGAPLPF